MEFGIIEVFLTLAIGIALIVASSIFSKAQEGAERASSGNMFPSASPTSTTAPIKATSTVSNTSPTASSNSSSPPPALSQKARDVADVPMSIYYGSQSGTAETFAYELQAEAKAYGFKAEVVNLEDFDADTFADESFAVMLMATFGEGEPTDNAVGFYEWLNHKDRKYEPNLLQKADYAVFALGNKQYEHFCLVGRRTDKLMEALGGKRLIEHGEGDDDDNLDEDYRQWKTKLWTVACKKFLGKELDASSTDTTFQPTINVRLFSPEEANKPGRPKYVPGLPTLARYWDDPKTHRTGIATVVENRELRQDTSDGITTQHLELDLSETRVSYQTADNLGIHCRHEQHLIDRCAKALNVSLDQTFMMQSKTGRKLPLPSPCTIEDALAWYLDITAIPRQKFLSTIMKHTEDEKEKSRLTYFLSDEAGKKEYHDYYYNYVELLEDFPGVKLPFAYFLELVPRVQHRFYTISSSSRVQPKQVSITCSHLIKDKPNGRKHFGICSTYIKKAQPDAKNVKMCIFVRPSTFRLPRKQCPIIMIGPGTGIAPFHAFIQELTAIKPEQRCEAILYFGCQKKDKDFIYKDVLEQAKERGVLTELHLAFSREQKEKVYVQDLLKKNAESTFEMISKKNAHLYVCGATSMGKAVKNTIIDAVEAYGKMTNEAARTYVENLVSQGRFVQELWS